MNEKKDYKSTSSQSGQGQQKKEQRKSSGSTKQSGSN